MLMTFIRLQPGRRRLLLRASLELLKATAQVHLLPHHKLRSTFALPSVGIAQPQAPSPEAIVWSVAAAARRIPRANCLPQAIAATRMFRHFGFPAEIRIGVARDPDFAAHAWVELHGEIVLGGNSSENAYVELPQAVQRLADQSPGVQSGI